jgi:hypothetical protein
VPPRRISQRRTGASVPRKGNIESAGAVFQALQILDEERVNPTIEYEFDSKRLSGPTQLHQTVELIAVVTAPQRLAASRAARPRKVEEDPSRWRFKSQNYNLLTALYSRVRNDVKPGFIEALLGQLSPPTSCTPARSGTHLVTHGLSSCLPLVAEFCARNGASQALINAVAWAELTPGFFLMLKELEELIAFNFTVFSDAEYSALSSRLDCVLAKTPPPQLPATGTWGGTTILLATLFAEVRELAVGIKEQCRKARYFYLKQSLTENFNAEINQDKDAVQAHLKSLGFSDQLVKALDEAERLYLDGASNFVLKASMGHLRSFLENLHSEAFPAVQSKVGGSLPTRWGEGLVYLRDNGVLSKKEEQFAAALYAIISDEAVHSLVAEHQYARLFRNVVIEYALLVLWKLDKLGLRPS